MIAHLCNWFRVSGLLLLMPVFSFQSELLSPELAATSSLRMVVGTHGVSLWAGPNKGKTLALKAWQFADSGHGIQEMASEIRMAFGSEALLGLPFKSRSCWLSCPASTLVPRRLFDPTHLSHYFKLLLRDTDNRDYGFEKLKEHDCYLVWAAEPELVHLCEQYFQRENIRHIAPTLLRAFGQLAPAEGFAVFADIRGQKVQIAVFERQNLVFFNAFDVTKPNDLLYFILLAYKQFELDPQEVPLTLSGTFTENSEAFKLLARYVEPMRFPPLPNEFELPEEAKSLPDHYWFDLSTVT